MILFAITVSAWADPEAPADCPVAPMSELTRATRGVLEAYDVADPEALHRAATVLEVSLECLRQPLPPAFALEVHRAKALVSHFDQAQGAEVSSWRAFRVLDPQARPDPDRWPEGHPVWRSFEEAEPVNFDTVELQQIPVGGWLIDGQPTEHVPKRRAFVAQALNAEQEVTITRYCYSEAELPDLGYNTLQRERRRKRMRVGGTTLSAVLLAGAATSFVVANQARATVVSEGTFPDYGEIDAASRRANVGASLAVGLAAGSVTTAVATWTIRW